MNIKMASNALYRLVFRKAAAAVPHLGKSRGFHSSGIKQYEYSNDYIHAPTMYNLTAMKNRKFKFGMLVFGGVGAAIGLPICAVQFQQEKASSGAKES